MQNEIVIQAVSILRDIHDRLLADDLLMIRESQNEIQNLLIRYDKNQG